MPVVLNGKDIHNRTALPDDPTMEEALLGVGLPPEVASEFGRVRLPFRMRPHQYTSLQAMLAWNRMGLFDQARCVPGETEFLTPTGWKRIDEYVEGDLVGQVEPSTREVTFVQPEQYIVDYDPEVVLYETRKGRGPTLQFMATRDHKLLMYHLTYHRDGRISKFPRPTYAKDILDLEPKLQRAGFANTFTVKREGLPLSDAEIRIMVAVIADGCFFMHRAAVRHADRIGGPSQDDERNKELERGRYNRSVEISVKKQRKAERIEALLCKANLDYKKARYGERTRYTFLAPRLEKEFTEFWWGASTDQLRVIAGEAEYWDGSRGPYNTYVFHTTSKASADFLQYAAAASGRTASMTLYRAATETMAEQWGVSIQDKEKIYGVSQDNLSFVENPDPENKVYCFTLPTGFFVTRFRGRIVLTGNCGKTICMQLAATYFGHYGMKSIFIMPPVLFDQFAESFSLIANHGMHVHVLNNTAATRKRVLKEIADGHSSANILAMTKEVFKLELLDLMSAGFQVLFFDECAIGLQTAKTKTQKGQRTTYASVKYFVDNTQDSRLILSTGTPVFNELIGTYPIISLKSPKAYLSEDDFNYTHVTYKQIRIHTPRGERFIRTPDSNNYKETALLQRNLHHQAVRARKLEVLDIKVPHIQEIPVTLHKGHQALYKRVLQEQILEIGTKMIDARNASKLRVLALQLITDPGMAYKPAPQNAVIETVQTLLDSTDVRHNKVVLFANFNQSVEHLAKTFDKLHPAVVYGPNGPNRNMEEVKKFRTDPDCRLLIANPQAGGVGLTLGDVSQTVIFVEPVSTPGMFDQASSRVVLSGQTEPVSIYFLRINNTISKKAIEVMLGRAQMLSLIHI